jgi:hypothetical protein
MCLIFVDADMPALYPGHFLRSSGTNPAKEASIRAIFIFSSIQGIVKYGIFKRSERLSVSLAAGIRA